MQSLTPRHCTAILIILNIIEEVDPVIEQVFFKKPTDTTVATQISEQAYVWCCQLQSDISIAKFDIFKHNRTQNVLMYDHHLCLFTVT